MMNAALLERCQRHALEWTRALVRLNSENPPGREIECARFCKDVLDGLGMRTQLDEFAPGRANLVASCANPARTGIVFNGHLDVVAAKDGWKYPPFAAELADGCIWGRGSADMKSGCAAMMAAAEYALEALALRDRGVTLIFVADEEARNLGARRLLERMRPVADACVVCEPTRLEVNYGNRGYSSFYVRTRGKSCHACNPENGENAIYAMAEAVRRLEAHARVVRERENPLLGRASLNVGTIRGGKSPNIVPDFCEIEVESRFLPGTSPQQILCELRELLGDVAQVELRSGINASLAADDSEIVRCARESCAAVCGRPAVVSAFPACSEAAFFSVDCAIPTLLLGPGDIGCAHKADERVKISEIRDAVEIYIRMIQHYTLSC